MTEYLHLETSNELLMSLGIKPVNIKRETPNDIALKVHEPSNQIKLQFTVIYNNYPSIGNTGHHGDIITKKQDPRTPGKHKTKYGGKLYRLKGIKKTHYNVDFIWILLQNTKNFVKL